MAASVLVAGSALMLTAPSSLAATPAQTSPASSPSASADVTWAPADTAAIHPGVMMYTKGAQCTANFVFTDGSGNVYVGYAAHCAGTGGATETNGCDAASLPLGTPVTFNKGGSLLSEGTVVGNGTLAYSSWLTMQASGESDADTCAYNDLALVKVDPQYVDDVNPSIPFWGGPTGINTTGTQLGDKVYTYGNSSLRAGVKVLSPHLGASLGDSGGGWSHKLYSVGPGIPGDSGSAFLDGDGNAVGVLSTLGLAPLPLSNNIGDLSHELTYAQAESGITDLALAPGTEPFAPVL
ncbi:MAG: hypothetical protein ACRDP4_04665 [Nocardioidaceae bacterium]